MKYYLESDDGRKIIDENDVKFVLGSYANDEGKGATVLCGGVNLPNILEVTGNIVMGVSEAVKENEGSTSPLYYLLAQMAAELAMEDKNPEFAVMCLSSVMASVVDGCFDKIDITQYEPQEAFDKIKELLREYNPDATKLSVTTEVKAKNPHRNSRIEL